MRGLRGTSLEGRRVLITGAARGIGAALAERLHERGARVALIGLEEDLLAQVAARCGDAPWARCDVTRREEVESATEEVVAALGGLDVVVANAGIAAQLPLVGGDPAVMERTIAVNVLGSYYTLRAAGPHISHANGYALADRLGRRRRAPAADGRLQRVEGRRRGARQHPADRAAPVRRPRRRRLLRRARHRHDQRAASAPRPPRQLTRHLKPFMRVAPLTVGIDALERGHRPPLAAHRRPPAHGPAAAAPHGCPAVHRRRRAAPPDQGAGDRPRRERPADHPTAGAAGRRPAGIS